MALTATSLSAACGASDLLLYITSTSSGFPAVGSQSSGQGQPMQVDGELMYITGVPVAGQVTVRGRGSDGTVAEAHAILAPVQTSATPTDFPNPSLGQQVARAPIFPIQMTIGANTNPIVIPTSVRDITFNLTKATALASTDLPAPTVAQNGLRVTLTSQTSEAHVITATTLINDGTSGVPHTTLTFAAFAGASIVLQAQNGLWNVVSNNGVTVS